MDQVMCECGRALERSIVGRPTPSWLSVTKRGKEIGSVPGLRQPTLAICAACGSRHEGFVLKIVCVGSA